jgi:hypothetical protein
VSCTSHSYHELLVSAGHVYIESRVIQALKYGSINEPYFRTITLGSNNQDRETGDKTGDKANAKDTAGAEE